jgi:hypothetical protein
MKIQEFAWFFFSFGILLLLLTLNFCISTQGFQKISEDVTLLPLHVVQIESDTNNGSLTFPLSITYKGHVYAAVNEAYGSQGFSLYSWYCSNSSSGQPYVTSDTVRPGRYYLIVPFTIPSTSSSDYYMAVGIYETIEKSNPYLSYAIISLISGTTLIVLSGYSLLGNRQVTEATCFRKHPHEPLV